MFQERRLLQERNIESANDFETKVMEPLQQAVGARTEVLVGYFAQHGLVDAEGDLSLRLSSCKGPDDNGTGQQGTKIYDLIMKLLDLSCAEDASIYLFMDFCREATPILAPSQAGQAQLRRRHFQRSVTILWACASRQKAQDGKVGANSPLATRLLDVLQDAVESMECIYDQVQKAVASETKNTSNGLPPQQVTLTRIGRESHKLSLGPSKRHARMAGVPPANESFTGRLGELNAARHYWTWRSWQDPACQGICSQASGRLRHYHLGRCGA